MEMTCAIATTVVDLMVLDIKTHIGYAFNYGSRVERLKELADHLVVMRDRVQHDVDFAHRNGEEIIGDVKHWLSEADRKITEVIDVMEKEAETAKKKCFIGLCPNVKSRYKLGRRADREATAIDELLRITNFDKVSYRASLPGIAFAPVRGFEAFESRRLVLNEIMEVLKDDSVSVIGVYGMAGVGKTTLVKEVAMQAMEVKLFDSIVVASVTQTPDVKKIQNEIADLMGLRFEEESMVGRAMRLFERLKKERRILLILDDIWGRLDLMEVGIPFGDIHEGCKIVLTSRSLETLYEMDAQKTFRVDVLRMEEAWDLFKKTAGDSVESPELRSTALEIAKRCAGLPIAILTVARALRNKGLFVWRDALRQLQRDFTGMEAGIYSTVKLSYDFLKREETRQIFLLCSLLGHHAAIQDLLKYTMGLGLFSDAPSVEENRFCLLSALDKLKDSSLLHESYTNERFDMHDLICDVAISIASREKNVFALKHEDVLTDWPNGERMEKCEWISLQYATVRELPDELKCPQLTFFSIGNKNPSLNMPPNFFKEMKFLKVLTLTKMHFSSLPSSICLLTDLHTLCLNQCVLGNIAGIGELKNLEILSLLRSDIEALPREMEQLLKLKLLDLSDCTELKVIPSNVLSRLSRLEELYLGDSFVQWGTGGHDDQRSCATLTEFRHLLNLSTLDVHIRDDRIMPKGLLLMQLNRYKVFIGDVWDWSGKFEYSRTLKLKLSTSIDLHPGVEILLKNTEDLYLDDLKGIKNVLYQLNEEGFQHLKSLHVQNNLEILYIVNAMKWSPIEAFPSLESLFLYNLINLEKIYHGQLGAGSFSKLRIIKVRCCGRLTNLLSFSMVKGLLQLQEFEVDNCKNVIELAFQEGEGEISEIEATGEIMFPQLHFLTIQNLPKLISFCSDDKRHSTSQQGKIQLVSGARSRTISLFDEKVVFCKLEHLKLGALNIQMLWHDRLPQVSSSLENLTTLVVEGCNNLKYLFSSFMVKHFVQLKNLEISSCKFLEEVITPKESRSVISLPNLVSLSLHVLPELKRFCFGNFVKFPFLKELSIRNCPLISVFIPSSVIRSTSDELVEGDNSRENMYTDTLPLFDDQVAFPALEKLIIIDLRSLKKIWHGQCKSNSFYKLKYLEVGLCEELKSIFPIDMLERLQILNELRIYNCDSLEVIVEPHEVNVGESDAVIATQSIVSEIAIKIVFPSVAYLQLYMLPKMRSFYPKLHSTFWSSLQKIQVCGCDKVHIFASENLAFQKAHDKGHLELSIQQSLFWVDKATFPYLQELWLECNAIMTEIWHGQLPANHFFPKLKVLKLICIPKESTILTSCFFRSFSKIPKLIVSDASFSEIFLWKRFGGETEHAWMLDQLSELSLSKLPELTHLWEERSQPQLAFQNLGTLKILGCGRLKNLVPSSVSFRSLMTLEVSKCHGFIYLITPSTARSMELLTMISITDCKLIEEIIAHEDNGPMYGLGFPKLRYLRLQNLPSLTSFYSGSDAFDLPSLDELIVRECPIMENFCKGELKAMMLQKVHLTEEDSGCWLGNVNATIKDFNVKKSHNHVKELGSLQWKLPKLWETTV